MEMQKSSHPKTLAGQHLIHKSSFAIQFTCGLIFFFTKLFGKEKSTFSLLLLLYCYFSDFQVVSHSSGLMPVYFSKALIWKIISLTIFKLSSKLSFSIAKKLCSYFLINAHNTLVDY